jgi:hypothetical protein
LHNDIWALRLRLHELCAFGMLLLFSWLPALAVVLVSRCRRCVPLLMVLMCGASTTGHWWTTLSGMQVGAVVWALFVHWACGCRVYNLYDVFLTLPEYSLAFPPYSSGLSQNESPGSASLSVLLQQ